MLTLLTQLSSIKNDRRGLAAIEYALIGSFMAVCLVAAMPIISTAITTVFTTIAGEITKG